MTDLAPLLPAATELIVLCTERGLKIATAESCTGGLIAATLTEVPGSSAVVDRGFVTYSNEAKAEMLGVDPDLIRRVGAVSKEVAVAMAEGAIARSDADLAVAVTGIAGPDGGTAEKPVGLVHLAATRRGGATLQKELRLGDIGRHEIRTRSVAEALATVARLAASGE
jgi:nicotinamide-nucleotide amidase